MIDSTAPFPKAADIRDSLERARARRLNELRANVHESIANMGDKTTARAAVPEGTDDAMVEAVVQELSAQGWIATVFRGHPRDPDHTIIIDLPAVGGTP